MNWDSVKDEKKDKIEKDITNLAAKLSRVGRPKVGTKTKFTFRMMANMHKTGWDSSPTEQQYWEQRGWLKKDRPWNQVSR